MKTAFPEYHVMEGLTVYKAIDKSTLYKITSKSNFIKINFLIKSNNRFDANFQSQMQIAF